jgi:hypothetical protein
LLEVAARVGVELGDGFVVAVKGWERWGRIGERKECGREERVRTKVGCVSSALRHATGIERLT